MHYHLIFCLALIGLTVNAQTINVRGTVMNQTGKPISNAIVTIVQQGLKDTTGTDGAYSISNSTNVIQRSKLPATAHVSLNRGVLKLSLANPSSVKVKIFDVKGNLLKELLQDATTGIYQLNIADYSLASKMLIVNVAIGQHVMTFRYLSLQNCKYSQNSAVESPIMIGSKLAKLMAVNDTLKTVASGYSAKTIAISSYDTVANITLDSIGSTGQSSGCGTTPKLQKSILPPNTKLNYNTVIVKGQSRRYLLWYPDNYDNTHPYRLVICYHWFSGSASQVFDCKTEGISCYTTQVPFFNLLNLANNSTIFVAPDGIDAGWANTNGRDLEFTDSILTQVKSNFCIDTTRIFACGFSYGGAMSYAIACNRAPIFRAVAVYAGGAMSGGSNAKIPIAYYGAHGISDGGIASGRAARDHFVEVNGCTAQNPPEPVSGSGTHICTSYSGCSDGHPVRWCAFDGGHDPSPKDRGQSTTWNAQETWNFFTQF